MKENTETTPVADGIYFPPDGNENSQVCILDGILWVLTTDTPDPVIEELRIPVLLACGKRFTRAIDIISVVPEMRKPFETIANHLGVQI